MKTRKTRAKRSDDDNWHRIMRATRAGKSFPIVWLSPEQRKELGIWDADL